MNVFGITSKKIASLIPPVYIEKMDEVIKLLKDIKKILEKQK